MFQWTKRYVAPSLSLYYLDLEAPEVDSSKVMSRSMSLCIRNAGRAGVGRLEESLFSIWTTDAMVGRYATFSWTHNNPIWMHLDISLLEPSPSVSSIKFEAVPSLQLVHACKQYMNSCIETLHTSEKEHPHKE